jgi:hypothetical protein
MVAGVTSRRSAAAAVAAAVSITTLAVASLFYIEARSPDFDPQYARVIVERTIRYGGSYYENGIHNKGPFEPAVYHLIRMLTSYDSFWFGIAVAVIATSLVAGVVARRVVALFGGPAWLGWTALAAVYIHLALSGADYAGVLYSRNMTATLLAIAFLLLTKPGAMATAGRDRLLRVVIAGGCLGLAVQTLQTAALSATVLGIAALVTIPRGRSAARGPDDRWWFVGAAAAAFLSAPVRYALIGPWREFWDGWWVYGRYMSAATGRSLFNQLSLGWNQFYVYGRTHAPATLAVIAFVLLGLSRWRQLSTAARRLHVILPCWWMAAWFEIILTQRYSSHYFVVTSLPLALMIVGVAAHLVDLVHTSGGRIGRPGLVGSLVVVASLLWSGTTPVYDGLRRASQFTGTGDLARERAAGRDGTTRAVQAVLDLVSEPHDPLLAWTNYPWTYLDLRRVPATRFAWKSFLVGEIYLGRTSPEFVLPGSWDDWRDDVAATNPAVYLTDIVFPVDVGTPAAQLLAGNFRPALTTPTLSLALRTDVLADLNDASSSTRWAPSGPVPTGWTAKGGSVTFDAAGGDQDALRLPLEEMRCRRWDAVVHNGGGLSFHFDDKTGASEAVEMFIDGDQAVTRSSNVEFLRLDIERWTENDLSLIVGSHSAIMLVDGVIVGALSLLTTTEVTVSSVGNTLELRDVGSSAAPMLGECSDDVAGVAADPDTLAAP